MKKDLIISIAVDGRDKYSEVVKGLEKSIDDVKWNGDVRIYKEFPEWCTPHSQTPYKFKYDLIEKAVADGYKKIFWFDSVMRLNDNISDLWQMANGVVLFDNIGHLLYKYISDQAVLNMNIPFDLLPTIRQTWGGAMGLDFNNPLSDVFFKRVLEQIRLGSFDEGISIRDGFVSHRHDQAVLSGIAFMNKIDLLPYGIIASKNDMTEETYIIYGD